MPPLAKPEPEARTFNNKAANEDFFEEKTCEQTLSQEDITMLFKKRKATEWMAANRTDGNSQEIYHKELTRILTEQKRYGISEENYEHYLQEVEEILN